VDYCHIADFENLKPKLAKRLLLGEKAVTDSTFAYTLMGKGKVHVHRIDRTRYDSMGLTAFHRTPMEHVAGNTGSKRNIRTHIKKHPYYKNRETQKKLLVVENPEK